MRSPVVSKLQMERVVLEEGLEAFRCSESSGVFLPVEFYFRWLSGQKERLPHLPVSKDNSGVELVDSEGIKICPESGQLMQRYRVGHGFSFYLDRSPFGSIWFDKGEWEALRERQFHDELHLIFTAPWQDRVRDEKKLKVERDILLDRLGEDLLGKIEKLRNDLEEHEFRDLAVAFLRR